MEEKKWPANYRGRIWFKLRPPQYEFVTIIWEIWISTFVRDETRKFTNIFNNAYVSIKMLLTLPNIYWVKWNYLFNSKLTFYTSKNAIWTYVEYNFNFSTMAANALMRRKWSNRKLLQYPYHDKSFQEMTSHLWKLITNHIRLRTHRTK